jgi:hypothetical protein
MRSGCPVPRRIPVEHAIAEPVYEHQPVLAQRQPRLRAPIPGFSTEQQQPLMMRLQDVLSHDITPPGGGCRL